MSKTNEEVAEGMVQAMTKLSEGIAIARDAIRGDCLDDYVRAAEKLVDQAKDHLATELGRRVYWHRTAK